RIMGSMTGRRRALLHQLRLEAFALDAPLIEAVESATADAFGHGHVGKTLMDFDLADLLAGEPACFTGEGAQNVTGAQLVFAAARKAQRLHLGVARCRGLGLGGRRRALAS